jgi:signal transduction histidine kinase
VRNIVELHGGSIRVDSEEGNGSTFTLRLPVGSVPGSEFAPRPG